MTYGKLSEVCSVLELVRPTPVTKTERVPFLIQFATCGPLFHAVKCVLELARELGFS